MGKIERQFELASYVSEESLCGNVFIFLFELRNEEAVEVGSLIRKERKILNNIRDSGCISCADFCWQFSTYIS